MSPRKRAPKPIVLEPAPTRAPAEVAPIRFRRFPDGRILVTADSGGHAWVTEAELATLVAGRLDPADPLHDHLAARGLLLTPETEAARLAALSQRHGHLAQATSLHIVIVTLRCNQRCRYCQASRKPERQAGWDMSIETADRTVDLIFQSPSPELTIEFQGGEPLLNLPVVKHIVERASARADAEGRTVYFTLVSNLSRLDDEALAFLVDRGVMICTSLDGPAALHDRNRPMSGGSSHAATLEAMDRIHRAYADRGLDPSLAYVNALLTVSRASLKQPRALVDEYVARGFKAIHLRPLSPFGFGDKAWAQEGYDADAFLAFYREALDYIIALNRQGVEIQEKMASLFLQRILTDAHPTYMDLRSPCGAGIGQLAYLNDGRVYLCDEARMVSAMGDDLFCIGHVERSTYGDLVRHESVGAVCLASCLEGLPGCCDCAYLPYCGVCPVYNYQMQGDLFAVQPTNDRCKVHKGVQDLLFTRLRDGGAEMETLLRRWTIDRDRSSVYRRIH